MNLKLVRGKDHRVKITIGNLSEEIVVIREEMEKEGEAVEEAVEKVITIEGKMKEANEAIEGMKKINLVQTRDEEPVDRLGTGSRLEKKKLQGKLMKTKLRRKKCCERKCATIKFSIIQKRKDMKRKIQTK